MPTRARNGARIVLRPMIALVRVISRPGDVQIGPRPIDFFLCGGHFVVQILSAIEHRLGEGSLRLLSFQLGLFDGDIKRH